MPDTRTIHYLSRGTIPAEQMAILKEAKDSVYDGLVKLVRIDENWNGQDWVLLVGIDDEPFKGWYVHLPAVFDVEQAKAALNTVLNDDPDFRARAAEIEWSFL